MTDENVFDVLKNSLFYKKREWLDFFQSWCDGQTHFIREFAMPYRRVTKDLEQLYRQVMFFSAQMHNDVFLTAYSYRMMKDTERKTRRYIPDYSTAYINKVYWDLDLDAKKGTCMQDTYDDAMKMFDYFGNDCRIYFSGGKGFHVYVDLLLAITKSDLREYTIFVMDGLQLKTGDRRFLGDIARIIRLPYCPHAKTKQYMIPITREMSLKQILDDSTVFKMPVPLVKKPIVLADKWQNTSGTSYPVRHWGGSVDNPRSTTTN